MKEYGKIKELQNEGRKVIDEALAPIYEMLQAEPCGEGLKAIPFKGLVNSEEVEQWYVIEIKAKTPFAKKNPHGGVILPFDPFTKQKEYEEALAAKEVDKKPRVRKKKTAEEE